MTVKLVSLEGSIGAGKSTFLKSLEDLNIPDFHVLYEPVDQWNVTIEPNTRNMFEMYYNDKKKYGFSFQMFVLQTRVQHLVDFVKGLDPQKDIIIVSERCPLTDYNIFADMMYSQGYMSDYDFVVYKKWYDYIVSSIPFEISALLYLRVDPNVCVERIMKRARSGEEKIDLHYLLMLHQKHEVWLNATNLPMLVLDGNGPLPDTQPVIDFINGLP